MALRVSGAMASASRAPPAIGVPSEPIRASRGFAPGSVLGGPPATYHSLPVLQQGAADAGGGAYPDHLSPTIQARALFHRAPSRLLLPMASP